MARKSSKTDGKKASPKKASAKKASAKKAGPKSDKSTRAAAPKAKSSAKKSAAPKGAKAVPKAKKAAVKLNEGQTGLLKKIHEAGEGGYAIGQKVEQRTVDALITRKLVKKGPKNKETGSVSYVATKTGQKHLGGPGGSSSAGSQAG